MSGSRTSTRYPSASRSRSCTWARHPAGGSPLQRDPSTTQSRSRRQDAPKPSSGAMDKPSPGFYSWLFLLEKVMWGWRPIIDLSAFSGFIILTKFNMETVTSVLESFGWGNWMFSVDLKDVYFQIPIHPDSRPYLRFCLEEGVKAAAVSGDPQLVFPLPGAGSDESEGSQLSYYRAGGAVQLGQPQLDRHHLVLHRGRGHGGSHEMHHGGHFVDGLVDFCTEVLVSLSPLKTSVLFAALALWQQRRTLLCHFRFLLGINLFPSSHCPLLLPLPS